MGILATLRQDRAGEWKTLDDYLRELRHRETGALAALANALPAPSHEQKELAEHGEAGAEAPARADVHGAPPRPGGGEARRPRAAMATQSPGSVHADGARSGAADLVGRSRGRRGESRRAEARRCGRGGSSCETAEAAR